MRVDFSAFSQKNARDVPKGYGTHTNAYYHSTALSLYSTPSGLARARMGVPRLDAVWTVGEKQMRDNLTILFQRR